MFLKFLLNFAIYLIYWETLTHLFEPYVLVLEAAIRVFL